MKYFVTDYKKEYLYGDTHLESWGHYNPLIGVRLKIKILGLFWITYKQFYYEGI